MNLSSLKGILLKNWKKKLMTEKEKVQEIANKYGSSLGKLSNEATAKEVKTVFKFFADEANRKQRELVGLKNK